MKPFRTDFVFVNHGSLYLCRPQNAKALKHLQGGVSDEAQWLGGAVAVEPRYVVGLVEQLRVEGWLI